MSATLTRVRQLLVRIDRLDRLTEAVGRIEARQVASDPSDDLNAHEFRAFDARVGGSIGLYEGPHFCNAARVCRGSRHLGFPVDPKETAMQRF